MSESFKMVKSDLDRVMTVLGPVAAESLGVTDAHNHMWIAPVPGAQPGVPVLFDQSAIAAELGDYRQSGGGAQIDCQPGGCGRDGRFLSELSRASGVHIVACTGFHLEGYYAPNYWLWRSTLEEASTYFVRELTHGLEETIGMAPPVRAGFIKVACQRTLAETSGTLLEAAAMASRETGAAIEIHTEQGASAEEIGAFFTRHGVGTERLVLCHMDKRPDIGLHRALARAGVMLEYDTFYRPQYQPEQRVWHLVEQMVADGLEQQFAIGTDMAHAAMWSRLGTGPGLAGLTTCIVPRLQSIGFALATVQRLVGENIAARLARPVPQPTPIRH